MENQTTKDKIFNSKTWLEKAEIIMDSASCYNSIEDEILKLVCLLTRCNSNLVANGEDMLSRKYVLEKATRILQRIPIILDSDGQRMYASIKMDQIEEKKS